MTGALERLRLPSLSRRSGSMRDDGAGGSGVVRAYLTQWAQHHRGVEAYIEPATHDTGTTVAFVAHDGEWTRRRVPSRDAAFEFARSLEIPVYDVLQTGYPARMRQWTSQQRHRGPQDRPGD